MSPRRRAVLTATATLALATSFSLAACGGDDAQPTAAADGSTSTVATTTSADALTPFTVITPEQGAALIAERSDVVVVDVRTPEEYATGHLENAVNVDVSASTFDAELAGLDPNGTYVVYCRSGNRSAQAVARMQAAGFTDVYDLGGIVGLQAAGYIVVTG